MLKVSRMEVIIFLFSFLLLTNKNIFYIYLDDNVSERIKEKLSKVYEHLRTTATDYQNLLESLISIFDDLVQVIYYLFIYLI